MAARPFNRRPPGHTGLSVEEDRGGYARFSPGGPAGVRRVRRSTVSRPPTAPAGLRPRRARADRVRRRRRAVTAHPHRRRRPDATISHLRHFGDAVPMPAAALGLRSGEQAVRAAVGGARTRFTDMRSSR
ncbi:MAG: hypothetical protein AVDCRST_MAG53-831 [uncultured Solirubrobacteraceae bacterium]|uniref:Uncharacterized protein n=1 Tax=uncultured Solirubrobacteraceae bacterium TaxID=1162706 RepID=A0A6J4S7M2_9ACTN|nr:MAG: hypothetical protein AVDCRST_MAG53-831 [uncultured Solirubrobacteraceae bacterium]